MPSICWSTTVSTYSSPGWAMSQETLGSMLDAATGAASSGLPVQPFDTWQLVYLYDNYMPPTRSDSTYEDNMDLLGYVDLESPSAINIYAIRENSVSSSMSAM